MAPSPVAWFHGGVPPEGLTGGQVAALSGQEISLREQAGEGIIAQIRGGFQRHGLGALDTASVALLVQRSTDDAKDNVGVGVDLACSALELAAPDEAGRSLSAEE